MKRGNASGLLFAPLLVGAAAAGAIALGGCPIYSADSCSQDPNCVGPTATTVPTATAPVPTTDAGSGCNCGDGYVCSNVQTGRATCVAYDCRAKEKACATGQSCTEATPGAWSCTTPVVDCLTTGCISGYTCSQSAPHGCVSTDPNACVADADCSAKTGAGSLCLGGTCKAPKDLCSDSTQCAAGKSCVDGRCITKCPSGTSCETGYSCAASTSLCTGGANACGAGGSSCPTGSTCAEGRCVTPCATDGSCATGLVCVAGGCVRDDRPNFFCDKNGTADGTQDSCAAGSICLHHNCYIACSGPNDTKTCAGSKDFPVCKSVTTSSGTHSVCGSSTTLGSECDPTASPPKSCAAGKICVDGFCK